MHGARFRYFDFVMVAFVVVLLLSNVVGAEKRSFVNLPGIGPWPFGAGILFFPISYVIDDVLTEVYGFARARRAIWAGFAALAVHGADGMDRGPFAGAPKDGPGSRPTSGCSGRAGGSSSPRWPPSSSAIS